MGDVGRSVSDSCPIRITYVIGAINTDRAGTEGHLLRLLRRLDRDRFDPELIVLQRSDWTDRLDDPRIPLHVVGFRSFRRPRDWSVISKLTDLFHQHQPRIVELHTIDAQFAGAIAAKRAKVPIVLSTRRDLGHQYGPKVKLMMRIGNRHVTRFLANANTVAEEMARLEGIDRSRFDVIHNGIDLSAFDANAHTSTTPEFETRTAAKRVVSIAANLREVKNVGLFIEAAARVAAQFDDAVFVIMGSGVLRGELEQQSERLGIADRTIFLGAVPTVAPYLTRSHVACLSSRSEGFSNSILEYMAAGVPVVATAVGGVAEAVVDGVTGFIVPPDDPKSLADKIAAILSLEEPDRRKMGRAARSRVAELFSMERHVSSHETLYARVLQTTR